TMNPPGATPARFGPVIEVWMTLASWPITCEVCLAACSARFRSATNCVVSARMPKLMEPTSLFPPSLAICQPCSDPEVGLVCGYEARGVGVDLGPARPIHSAAAVQAGDARGICADSWVRCRLHRGSDADWQDLAVVNRHMRGAGMRTGTATFVGLLVAGAVFGVLLYAALSAKPQPTALTPALRRTT